MRKITLHFELPEDKDAFTLAQKGSEFWSKLWELDQECRGFLKYGHQFKSADEVIEYIRQKIHEVDIDCVE